MKRLICLVMMLCIAITLVPFAAMAAEEFKGEVAVIQGLYENRYDKIENNAIFSLIDTELVGKKSLTISAKNYDSLFIDEDGSKYDLLGMHTIDAKNSDPIANGKGELKIPAYPQEDAEKQAEWYEDNAAVLLAYGPHKHVPLNNEWFFSLTNHWRKCKYCREIYDMNWHHDTDHNDICDQCETTIHYYDVTVAETTGGKVTVSKDKAVLNDTVEVTITPDSGYKVKSVAFYNDNDIHSQLTQYVDDPGRAYHFVILPWDAEVVVEFEADK